MKFPVVAVALSGGVDSLVSGFLVKKAFKEVFGIHFTTGYESRPADLKALENQLGFPVYPLDLSAVFEEQVVQYFIATYLRGKTPNPCVICNKQIKFGALLDKAGEMGADIMATGHYAAIVNSVSFPEKTIPLPWLEQGADPVKDQSYFLSMLSPDQLARIVFPLAGFTKTQVRTLAKKNNLHPSSPSESQDICFIQDHNFSRFIMDKTGLDFEPGPIKDLTGKVVGSHGGLCWFTVGQRRGINCPASEPYYVHSLDLSSNTLVVCFKKDLAQSTLEVDGIVWNDPLTPKILETRQDLQIMTKIRYSHKGAASRLIPLGTSVQVKFETPQPAVTPGQIAVFYRANQVLGAGFIQ